MTKKQKRNLKKEITANIIKALEKGVAPWVKGWSGGDGFPINGGSKRRYRGVNVLNLIATARFSGYSSNEWFTYKQANDLGGSVRAGQRGSTVVFTKWNEVITEDPETGEEVVKTYPILLGHTVFNRDQLEDMPEPEAVEDLPEKERHARADRLIKATGAKITYGDARAYYRPSTDEIAMPRIEQFDHESEYYSTHLHELVHWSGSQKRLDRDLSGSFGTESYAFEELVAELGAAFTCGELGVDGKLQHAEYIGSWIKKLKNDNTYIFKASALAEKAATFLMDFEESIDESEELAAQWEALVA